MNPICYACKSVVALEFKFCPNCGVSLKELGAPSVVSQIGIFLLSFLLPPLGLFPAFKLLKKPEPSAKRTALIAILLTIISLILTMWAFSGFMSYYSATLKNLDTLNL